MILKREIEGLESVLDLGCGKNSPIGYIRVKYKVGVDKFKPYVAISRNKRLHHRYIIGDVRNIEFKDSSFEVVVALDLIEHLTKSEGLKLIKKWRNGPRRG